VGRTIGIERPKRLHPRNTPKETPAQTKAKTQYRKIKTAATSVKHPLMTEKGRYKTGVLM